MNVNSVTESDLCMDEQLAVIKKPNVVEKISREEFEFRVREIAKCKRDISYFAEKYFKIINLDVGLTTIKLYPKQHELLAFFVNNKRCITLASRQSSKTTTYTIYLLWLTMFHNEKRVMLLANKADTALEILERIRLAYSYIPEFLKPGVVVWNKGELRFSNMSVIKGFATSSDAARGYSCNVVVMDEAAFVPNNIASKVFESIYPVISSSKNSQFIMVSTPNGADPNNLYYELWQKANAKEKNANTEGWKAFRFDWWDVPGRDEQWKENTIASIGKTRFDQEFGNVFLANTTQRKLIPDDIVERYRMKHSELKTLGLTKGKTQRILSESQDKLFEFTMWHEFDENHTYVASGDISDGTGNDSSVLYIWDITDLSNVIMCAKFASNAISVVEFAYVITKILALYNNPWFLAERNGCSSGTLDALRITYKYPRLATEGRNNEVGVFSHISVKGRSCLWTREMMTTDGFGFTFYDKDLIEEMTTFARKDTKGTFASFQAIPPAHDDLMMTFVWLCYMLHNEIIEKYFVVVDTFTSTLGKTYAKHVQPLVEYTHEEIKAVTQDKMYKEFMEFKDEMGSTLKAAMSKMNNDVQPFQQKVKYDPYFGDIDTAPMFHGTGVNPNNEMPQFFVF